MPMMQREPDNFAKVAAARRYYEEQLALTQQRHKPTRTEVREELERAERRRKEEEKEAARQREKLIEAHLSYLQDEWLAYQRVRHNLPPELLPLEAEQEFSKFKEYTERRVMRTIDPEAFLRFETQLKSAAVEGHKAANALRRALSWARLLAFGKLGKILRGLSLSSTRPRLSPPAGDALANAQKIVRSKWAPGLPKEQQSLLSIHRSGGKTIIQLGSSKFGFFYLTFRDSLFPEDLIRQILGKLGKSLDIIFPPKSAIAIYDGDYQELNLKHIFRRHRVIRTTKYSAQAFLDSIPAILSASAPMPSDSSLHIGVPASESDLSAVFPGAEPDMSLWQGIYAGWRNRADRQGFGETALEASRDAVLRSLASSKNVIIVAAHAREQILYFPAPPPEGSQLRPDDLEDHKASISANKPIVYLFCCEVAEVDALNGLTAKFLECGVSAVIAPQTQIDAHKSARLFEALVRRSPEPVPALTKLLEAERRTGYREMEVWIG